MSSVVTCARVVATTCAALLLLAMAVSAVAWVIFVARGVKGFRDNM